MTEDAKAAIADKLVTAAELLQHPEWERCELIEGKVRFMSPAGAEHGDIAGTIFGLLFHFVRQRELGKVFAAETGFILSRNPDTVRAPDLMYLAKQRIPTTGIPKGFLPLSPDLAVEVVSPTDAFSEVTEKAQSYITAGVRLVWVVDPQTRRAYVFRNGVEVRSLSENDRLSGEDVLPGFELPLKEVFAD